MILISKDLSVTLQIIMNSQNYTQNALVYLAGSFVICRHFDLSNVCLVFRIKSSSNCVGVGMYASVVALYTNLQGSYWRTQP